MSSPITNQVSHPQSAVAVVGMAGRFPGAPDVDALWERVRRGDDCLTDLVADELIAAGLPPTLVRSPDYVLRAGVLDDVAGFDAGLFGISPRDASLMDPQHRHFLECAWAALESAGCVPERFDGAIGVFAGCGMNTYLLNNLVTNPELVEQVGWFRLRHTGNDKDFLPTFVSYKLDLRGPSLSVQTACSTSLVAIHLAAQSLLSLECDLALAGGVTIEVPYGNGYPYRPGEILAPDGHCRAFDAESAGTVLTSGAGVVALRRLADAIDDGDPILAVIIGTAVNNDGRRKVGFLAPSVDGHADVVKEALAVAGVSARDIQLVEAHGTGTAVGDPIEVAALTEAFRASTADRGFCRLSSTKPNVGHLDTAAGVASLIKVVQALRHATLPPLANHVAPNPLLDIEQTPFVLPVDVAPWPADAVRRAGISSLGVGGTNAHVIVEESPALPPTPPPIGAQVLVLSAHDDAALVAGADRLAAHLEADPTVNLADVAHTLATGRKAMTHRRVVVAFDSAGAAQAWRDPRRGATGIADAANAPGIAFLFPGGGSQYAGMASGFDDRFAAFYEMRQCGIDAVRDAGGPDLAPILLGDTADPVLLRQADVSLPAVFVTSVALARQWFAWGVTPSAMCGHSLGEYAAAHLAGVLSFDDAVGLVVTRSRLMSAASAGGAAMLVVPVPEATVRADLPTRLSIAVVNADDECVVAGGAAEIDEFARRLANRGVTTQTIPLAAAAHSALLDPYLDEFHTAVKGVGLAAPQLPYVSNVSGEWITDEQATDPQYWVDHLRSTVRFAEGLRTLLAAGPAVTVELGPGQALTSLARRRRPAPRAAIAALRHPDDPTPDDIHTLTAFAKQWATGAGVDLAQFAGSGRRKLHLPTYAFQHQPHWIEPGGGTVTRAVSNPTADDRVVRLRRLPAARDWFWEPTWVEQPPLDTETLETRRILLVADRDDALAEQLVVLLRARGHTVVAGEALDPEALPTANTVVILDPPKEPVQDAADSLDAAAARWLGQAVDAVRAIGLRADRGTRLVAVTRGATSVNEPAPRPHHALAIGPVLVAPKEYPGLTAALVDVDREPPSVAALVAEIEAATTAVVAYRGGVRHTLGHRHVATREAAAGAFRKGGVYVVTGALGAVGSVIATHLAVAHRAKLVVVSSRPLPPEHERDRWLRSHGSDDSTSRRIRRLRDLERLGTTVVTVTADVADRAALSQALDAAERAVGPITGGVHAAGVLRDRLLAVASPDDLRTVLSAKAIGAAHLADELRTRGAELLVLTSSTSTLLAAPGQSAYVAANSYLDALAGQRGSLRVVTINFGAWAGPGMAADAARQARLGLSAGEPVTHPVFTSRRVDGAAIEVIGQLDSRYDWVLDEHRTASGLAILPGAGHAELMLGALALVGAPLGLRDVALLRPLAIPEDAPAVVRVRLEAPGDDGSRRVWLDASPEPGSGWVRYSEAVAEAPAAEPPPQRADRAGWTPFDPLERPRRDLVLGRRWECVVSATRNGDRAVADLALPGEFGDESAWWRAHPALVDAATAVAVGLDTPPGEQLLVPAGYDRVTVYGPVGPAIGAIAELRSSDGGSLHVDVTLVDGDAVRARFEGIRLRGVDPRAFGTMEDEVAEARLDAAGAFVEIAERLGIRASDAPEVLERAVGSGLPRLIASSVDLDQLLVRSAPPDEPTSSGMPTTSKTTAQGTTGERLTAMWCDLLGVAEVAPDADFFELGGHSLIAIRLMARIQRELGVQLPIAAVIEARTIDALTEMIAEERPDLAHPAQPAQPGGDAASAPSAGSGSRYKPIMALRSAGSRQPLFVVHGATGEVLFLHNLVRHLDPDRPVYGIHAIGTDSRDRPDPTVEAMVDRYIDALIAEHAEPYLLGGYSGGGIIAIEMARQLQTRGRQVTAVILFDCVARGRVPWSRRQVWSNVAKNLITSGPTAVRPYLSERLASRLRRMTAVPHAPQETATTADDGIGTTVDLFDHFTDIAARFEMRAVDADVILLKAEQTWPALPGDYYWTPYVNGMLRTEYVGGHHNSMFDAVNAPGLGRRVETIIAEYESLME